MAGPGSRTLTPGRTVGGTGKACGTYHIFMDLQIKDNWYQDIIFKPELNGSFSGFTVIVDTVVCKFIMFI